MRREAKLLLNSGINSLILSIEHFNRPSELGRVVSVLMLLNHAFEMLLKAVIIHKGGGIREKRARETIGFDKCIRKCLTDAKLKCIEEEHALTIQMINSQRDAATHYVLDISEDQLYMHVQTGVTLFADILSRVFGESLSSLLPQRVLPISIRPPSDLLLMIDNQIEGIKRLLSSSVRKVTLAMHKLRTIMIMEYSVRGDSRQPSDSDLRKLAQDLIRLKDWKYIFPGISSLKFNTEGKGYNICLRITKKEGIPIKIVGENEKSGMVVALKRVNELDFYSLNATQLSEKLRLSRPKTIALIEHLGIKSNTEYFKEIEIGSQRFKRYSPLALDFLKQKIREVDTEEIWDSYKQKKNLGKAA